MRKVVALAMILGLVAASSSVAQEPTEVPLYFAVGIAAGNEPTIDGDNADWAWVDNSFEVTIDDMNALTGGADDADDLFIDLLIGWSANTNSIYSMIHVHDNDLIVDKNPTCTFRDDNCEVHFDPDNGGGGPYSAPNDQDIQPAYQMCLSFSEQFPRVQMYNGAIGLAGDAFDFWWTHSGDFVSAGHLNTGEEYYYEFSAILFDPISMTGGPDASTLFNVAAEQTIGMSISVDDADLGINASGNLGEEDLCTNDEGVNGCPEGFFWQAQYSMAEQFMNTGGMPDVFLTPVDDNVSAVEENSWGQIKALMNENL